jgi:RNA polymerase sigma factor (sigma-70 family)
MVDSQRGMVTQILQAVERRDERRRSKHGGSMKRFDADEVDLTIETPSIDVLALDDALERLAQRDRRSADIVMLRYFAGLNIEETAKVLGISDPTVARDWQFARCSLRPTDSARAERLMPPCHDGRSAG